MAMEKRAQIGLRLPPSLVERLDEARRRMEFPPDRTEIIERAIEDWLAARGFDSISVRQSAAHETR